MISRESTVVIKLPWFYLLMTRSDLISLSQANSHGSPSDYPAPPPPDQFPDLLDIPDRHRQCRLIALKQ